MSRRAKKSPGAGMGNQSHLLNLPLEIQEDIISYTGPYERCSLRLVCSYIRNIVDHCRIWQQTCITLSDLDTPPAMWQLLRKRKVVALDISRLNCSATQMQHVLTALPQLRELHISTMMLFHLGYLHCLGHMDHITDLKLYDMPAFKGSNRKSLWLTMTDGWEIMMTPTLSNITKLTIHNFEAANITSLILKLAELEQLEFLDLEIAWREYQDIIVEARMLSTLLYKLKRLTHLRLCRVALDSLDNISPFDPTTCPTKHHIPDTALLRLKTLHLQVELSDKNVNSKYNLLRKSDLKFMPELKCLKYGIYSTSLPYGSDACRIEMNDWNVDETGPAGSSLEELHVCFAHGTCLADSKKSLDWLLRLPKSIRRFSLCESSWMGRLVITKLGFSLGACLQKLHLKAVHLITDKDLHLIAKTFVKLTSLTCGTAEKILAESLLLFEKLPDFRRLQLTSYIPDETLNTAKANMKRQFTIISDQLIGIGTYNRNPFRD